MVQSIIGASDNDAPYVNTDNREAGLGKEVLTVAPRGVDGRPSSHEATTGGTIPMAPITIIGVELTIGDTNGLTVIAGGEQASPDNQTNTSSGSTPLPVLGILRPENRTAATATTPQQVVKWRKRESVPGEDSTTAATIKR